MRSDTEQPIAVKNKRLKGKGLLRKARLEMKPSSAGAVVSAGS